MNLGYDRNDVSHSGTLSDALSQIIDLVCSILKPVRRKTFVFAEIKSLQNSRMVLDVTKILPRL